jgi:mannose-6-phosphate isomerase-like protein (cupin superfamily)
MMNKKEQRMQAVAQFWKAYLDDHQDWQKLIKGITPVASGCGPVYELPNPVERPGEDFAIVDMRELKITEPHYHINNTTEIYIVIEGSGIVIVGHTEHRVQKGSVIITPPDKVHYTVSDQELVIAAINTPPFDPKNYIVVTETRPDVGFEQQQFARLQNA